MATRPCQARRRLLSVTTPLIVLASRSCPGFAWTRDRRGPIAAVWVPRLFACAETTHGTRVPHRDLLLPAPLASLLDPLFCAWLARDTAQEVTRIKQFLDQTPAPEPRSDQRLEPRPSSSQDHAARRAIATVLAAHQRARSSGPQVGQQPRTRGRLPARGPIGVALATRGLCVETIAPSGPPHTQQAPVVERAATPNLRSTTRTLRADVRYWSWVVDH